MTDYYLGVGAQSLEWELRSNVQRFGSGFGGVTRTHERVGSRWAATFRYEVTFDRDAARLRSFLAQQRGGANRFYAYDPSYSMRGGFASSELLANPEWATSTTSWVASTGAAITAADRALRVTQTAAASSPSGQSAAFTAVQYAPIAGRGLVAHGRGTQLYRGGFLSDGGSITGEGTYLAGAPGLFTGQIVPATTSALLVPGYNNVVAAGLAGDFFEVRYASAARCALIDNAPNMLLRSNDGANAAWTKNASTSGDNATAGPDGTTTAEFLAETVATAQHSISQGVTAAAAAGDYALSFYVKTINRGWCMLQMSESTGSTFVIVWFNLTTGAVGTIATGANWANVRTFSQDMGGGWFRVTLVARKTSVGTTVTGYLNAATADGTSSYLGVAAPVALLWWHASLAASSVPLRDSVTTSALTAGTSQTGSSVYLKGLPASTSNLLYAGDWVEIITPTYSELKRVTAPLNSDGLGLGYLQFEPNLRQSPADGAAVIITKPLCRMLLDESTVKTQHTPAGFMAVTFTAVEDVAV